MFHLLTSMSVFVNLHLWVGHGMGSPRFTLFDKQLRNWAVFPEGLWVSYTYTLLPWRGMGSFPLSIKVHPSRHKSIDYSSSVNRFFQSLICAALVLTLTRIKSWHKLSIKQKPWILWLALHCNHTSVFMPAVDIRLPPVLLLWKTHNCQAPGVWGQPTAYLHLLNFILIR